MVGSFTKLKALSHNTPLARSCLIFRSAVRSQENPDIFSVKGSVTASLQPPRRCYGALVAFYCVPTDSCWRFSALSRRFQSSRKLPVCRTKPTYFGNVRQILSVCWTVCLTKNYNPEKCPDSILGDLVFDG